MYKHFVVLVINQTDNRNVLGALGGFVSRVEAERHESGTFLIINFVVSTVMFVLGADSLREMEWRELKDNFPKHDFVVYQKAPRK